MHGHACIDWMYSLKSLRQRAEVTTSKPQQQGSDQRWSSSALKHAVNQGLSFWSYGRLLSLTLADSNEHDCQRLLTVFSQRQCWWQREMKSWNDKSAVLEVETPPATANEPWPYYDRDAPGVSQKEQTLSHCRMSMVLRNFREARRICWTLDQV